MSDEISRLPVLSLTANTFFVLFRNQSRQPSSRFRSALTSIHPETGKAYFWMRTNYNGSILL
ncbi:uncharacterized protein Dvar_69710 [Desulfosarcina variabilis str. Montpellier]